MTSAKLASQTSTSLRRFWKHSSFSSAPKSSWYLQSSNVLSTPSSNECTFSTFVCALRTLVVAACSCCALWSKTSLVECQSLFNSSICSSRFFVALVSFARHFDARSCPLSTRSSRRDLASPLKVTLSFTALSKSSTLEASMLLDAVTITLLSHSLNWTRSTP